MHLATSFKLLVFHLGKKMYIGLATRERRLCIVLMKDKLGIKVVIIFVIITMLLATFLSCLCFIQIKFKKFYRHGHS